MRTGPLNLRPVLLALLLAVPGTAAADPAEKKADEPGDPKLLAEAQQPGAVKFVYTSLDLEKCEVDPDSEAGYGRWLCAGVTDEWPVHVLQDDLRMTVSYGAKGAEERAAQQWFGPFNHIHDTLEWVLTAPQESDDFTPAATILRFILEYLDETTGETAREHPILVVTQLKPGAVCHIAYVDARANPKANEDARAAAMRLAGSFDCEAEPELVGPQTPGVFAE